MNSPFPHLSNHEPFRDQATRPEEAESQKASLSGPRTRNLWFAFRRWIRENTFAPEWMPKKLRHPLVGYLVAMLVELAAGGLILLLHSLIPSLIFHGILVMLGVVLIALGWGAGPSLFATVLGALLLYFAVLPLQYSRAVHDLSSALGLVLYLAVGVSISLLAGQSAWALRKSEKTAHLLAQAEARSRFDAERLRTVLDVLPSAVLITSPGGQLLAMNQATKTLWGGDIAPGTDFTEYSQSNQYTAWRSGTSQPLAPEEWTLVRALSSGQAVLNDEIDIEALDGQRRTILNSAAPIRDETGAITGAVISAQDISALRRLEREAAAHAQELEAIFDAITDGITVLDAQGRLVRTNRAFRTLSGADRHPESLALPMDQRLAALAMRDEQGQPLDVEAWPATRLLRGEILPGVDVLMTNVDGREIILNLGGAPIHNHLGQVSGCVGVFRDMTARHQLEQHTRETIGALVAMAEAMAQIRPATVCSDDSNEAPLPVVTDVTLALIARRLAELTRSILRCRRVSITAVDTSTGWLNPVTEVCLSHEQEQACWASWSPPQRLEERYGATIAAALYAGKPAPLDRRHLPERSWYTLFQAESGRILPMQLGEELVGTLLVDYQEPDHDYSREDNLLTETLARLGALVLERDRLLRGWAETRAKELALGETQARMDTFLSIASHELRTPLTSLKLSLQFAQRRLHKLTTGNNGAAAGGRDIELQPAMEQLSRTVHQVERLELLVNDLVDVSRIQAGKLELHPDHADLVAIVHAAVMEQREAAPGRRIHLQRPANRPVLVYADTGRIEQVVTNFLTNALKYSPADRPVDVEVQVERQQVWVSVRDRGPGLPMDEQEHIWERFHRAKGVEVQSGTGVGLGLGLYISRMIVERHHGQVGVESSLGNGATFWFTLPLPNATQED